MKSFFSFVTLISPSTRFYSYCTSSSPSLQQLNGPSRARDVPLASLSIFLFPTSSLLLHSRLPSLVSFSTVSLPIRSLICRVVVYLFCRNILQHNPPPPPFDLTATTIAIVYRSRTWGYWWVFRIERADEKYLPSGTTQYRFTYHVRRTYRCLRVYFLVFHKK